MFPRVGNSRLCSRETGGREHVEPWALLTLSLDPFLDNALPTQPKAEKLSEFPAAAHPKGPYSISTPRAYELVGLAHEKPTPHMTLQWACA